MDVSVQLKDLRPAVSAARKASGRHCPGITLTATAEGLVVAGSDFEVAVSTVVPATVRSNGSVTVDGAALGGLVRGSGSLHLALEDGFLQVVNGITTELAALEALAVPVVECGAGVALDLATVREVAVAASGDDARPILAAVLFDGEHIVATDSYRLHVATVDGAAFATALVPSRAFAFLPKGGAATMALGTSTVPGRTSETVSRDIKTGERTTISYTPPPTVHKVARLVSGAVTVTVRLVDGESPNWKQLMPKDQPFGVTVDREQLAKVVKGVGATIPKPGRYGFATPVVLTPGAELVVSAHKDGRLLSSGAVPAKTEGDAPAIAFNPGFLVDALSTLRDEKATLRYTDPLKPACLTEERDGGRAVRLLMPVRIA